MERIDPENFSSLLAAAQAGDKSALAELHERHMGAVLARARDRMRPGLRRQYDTVDIAQSIFAEVIRELPRFEDRGEKAFRNWLYIRTERKIIDKLRKIFGVNGRAREDPIPSDLEEPAVPGPGPRTAAAIRDEIERLESALVLLPEIDRQVVELRGRQNFSHEEVAERLGLASADAARMRFARALLALRKQWRST